MSTVEGPHDPFVAPSGALRVNVHGATAELTQCSPSQLPDLLGVTEQLDTAELNGRVVAALRELLCCPICHRLLLHDPAVVDTCGHVFCYSCINLGIENGCLPVASAERVEAAEEEVQVCGSDDHHPTGLRGATAADPRLRCPSRPGRRRPRRRRRKFTCPVCLGPAHKWNLVRVRFFSDLVTEALSHATLAAALPPAEAERDASAQMGGAAASGEEAKTPAQHKRAAAQKKRKKKKKDGVTSNNETVE
ncbi:conserved RING finger protein [Trypanosoma conorhini]|uniref:Conserved RING finger protein n=1 Tax=Trypanosoma conorhini TaxID=83891 RepID=A0A3R7PXM9_9TRYP|nr:conserved RING finger protein [Trypanosoma conorhini]RNF26803.1 conserved RING finger protein [Trypanosoma conorhini]